MDPLASKGGYLSAFVMGISAPPLNLDTRSGGADIPLLCIERWPDVRDTVHGFRMHHLCMSLTERIIGPLATEHIGVFLHAVRKGRAETLRLYTRIAHIRWNDPMRIPHVGRLIKTSIIRAKRRKPPQMVDYLCSPSSRKKPPAAMDLPLGIIFIILDSLQDTDMKNLLLVTHWEIPVSYWRCRVRNGILFEVDKFGPEADMDWQFLCLESVKMVEKGKALWARQQIFNILNRTADHFLADLKSCPQLETVELARDKRKWMWAEKKGEKRDPKSKRRREWKRHW